MTEYHTMDELRPGLGNAPWTRPHAKHDLDRGGSWVGVNAFLVCPLGRRALSLDRVGRRVLAQEGLLMSPFLRRLTLAIRHKSSLCSRPDSLNGAFLGLEGGRTGETLRALGPLGEGAPQRPSLCSPAVSWVP